MVFPFKMVDFVDLSIVFSWKSQAGYFFCGTLQVIVYHKFWLMGLRATQSQVLFWVPDRKSPLYHSQNPDFLMYSKLVHHLNPLVSHPKLDVINPHELVNKTSRNRRWRMARRTRRRNWPRPKAMSFWHLAVEDPSVAISSGSFMI